MSRFIKVSDYHYINLDLIADIIIDEQESIGFMLIMLLEENLKIKQMRNYG